MTERNHFVDTLKGVFIIFVILLHFPFEPGVTNRVLFPFWATMAVPCFMFLSGYVCSLSFKKKGLEYLSDMYAPKDILKRLLRFVIPFTIAFIAEWVIFRIFKVYIVDIITYGVRAFCIDYITGGKGPGSYYFPVMLQFVFVFPIIFVIVKKFRMQGVSALFLLDMLYEIIASQCLGSEYIYRLLFFRYLFPVAAGAYFALEDKIDWKKKKCMYFTVATTLVGAFCIYMISYYPGYEPLVYFYWRTTAPFPCLFAVPILGVLVQHVKKGFAPLEIVGKASFNIFLVQMIYYNFIDNIGMFISYPPLLLAYTVVACCGVGVLFYLAENSLTKKVISKI